MGYIYNVHVYCVYANKTLDQENLRSRFFIVYLNGARDDLYQKIAQNLKYFFGLRSI